MPAAMREATGGRIRHSPAYDALVARVRRVGIEDGVGLLGPGEYHVDTSPLVQMLRSGHRGVALDREGWERLVTWADLNAPFFGTWGEISPLVAPMHRRRMEMWAMAGGPPDDPEAIPETRPYRPPPFSPSAATGIQPPPPVSPLHPQPGRDRVLDLGDGVRIELVEIPGGEFTMGTDAGPNDTAPPCRVRVAPFWMSRTEISNRQFRRLMPGHSSGRYLRRHAQPEGDGLSLDGDD